MKYSLFIILILAGILVSCGGGGGRTTSPNPDDSSINYPTQKFSKDVGDGITASITATIATPSLEIRLSQSYPGGNFTPKLIHYQAHIHIYDSSGNQIGEEDVDQTLTFIIDLENLPDGATGLRIVTWDIQVVS